MARHPIPQVIDDLLTPLDASGVSLPAIPVGSAGWYRWLNDPATRSFAFHSPQGTLTARREQRHGTWYWYAYRSQDGNLHKVYLGKSEELTPARLNDIAARLATESINRPQESNKAVLSPFPSPASSHRLIDLLTTKLYAPPPRLNMVARPQLIQQMNVAVRGTLTLIVAPAGWGKTTLLSAWHADPSHGTLPLAWVSLDAGDNDPIRFWRYVIAALNTLHPSVGEIPLALLYASSTPPIEAMLMSLLNALIQLPTETVLVLDDYHLIEAQSIHDALTYLVEHLPPNVHLVLASRSDPLLPLARVRIAQGRAHPTGSFLSEALALLARLLEDAEVKMRISSLLEILLLRALALDAQGNHTESLAALSRALTLAEPEGYIRLFIDEGAPVVALLRQVHAHEITPGYVATLLEASGEQILADSRLHTLRSNSLKEPLTQREYEVLRLLLDGASNREIAQQLVLSVNTVKKHVYNICGKLGVQSRSQAIAKARTLTHS